MKNLGKDSLVLHSFRRCPFAIRVRMVLEEKQLPYRIIEEDLAQPSAELLAMHPEGRVPLLIHQLKEGPFVLYQSTVITEYLEEAFPDFSLMPKDPVLRAQLRLWTYWCDAIFKPDLDLFKYELKTLNEGESAALLARLHEHFSKWEAVLEKEPYLLGAEFTLADIHLFPFARQFMAIKPPLAGLERYKQVSEWLGRILARPSFERAMRTS